LRRDESNQCYSRRFLACDRRTFGPPVLQVGSELGSWLQEQALRRVDGRDASRAYHAGA
jgi:hypothetical protein